MSESGKDVYLLGSSLTGEARAKLLNNLAALFKKDVPTIERMLRKSHTLIKANVDLSLAEKYKEKIEAAGGQCELVDHGSLPEIDLPKANQKPALNIVQEESKASLSTAPDTSSNSSANSSSSSYQFKSFCNKCGEGLLPGRTRCPNCRAPVKTYAAKNKTLAGFLALLLGGLGIHRFYLGQWWGILYLLFCFTLIPAVIAIIEAFVFWFTSDETWDGKYGNVEDNSGLMIVVAVGGFFGFIFVTGILAAIAIPQYQTYVDKSKIYASLNDVEAVKEKVENFYLKAHEYPNDNILIGIPSELNSPAIQSIKLSDGGAIHVLYKIPSRAQDPTIIWRPSKIKGEAKIRWDCDEGGMPNIYRPKECQSSADQTSLPKVSTTDSYREEKPNEVRGASVEKLIESRKANLSLKVPSDWSRNDMFGDAPLLVVSSSNEKYYAMVLSESKVDFDKSLNLQKYVGMLQKSLVQTGKNHQFSDVHLSVEKGMPVASFEMKATMEGVNLGYSIQVVESDTNFYRVLAWTLQSSFDQDKPLLQKVTRGLELHE